MIRKSVAVAAAVGFVAVGAAQQAHAGLLYSGLTHTAKEAVIYSGNQNLDLTGLGGVTPEVLPVDQANSGYFGANYQITGISLTFSGTIQIEGSLTNSGSSAATGYVNGGTTYAFTAASGALAAALSSITLSDTFTQANISVPAASGGVNGVTNVNVGDGPLTNNGSGVSGGVSTSALLLSQSLFGQLEYSGSIGATSTTNITNFAATSGTGNSTFYGGGNSGSSGTGSGVVAAVKPYGDTAIFVTYTYTRVAIPEPVSAVLLGSSLLGLGAMRMRRRKI